MRGSALIVADDRLDRGTEGVAIEGIAVRRFLGKADQPRVGPCAIAFGSPSYRRRHVSGPCTPRLLAYPDILSSPLSTLVIDRSAFFMGDDFDVLSHEIRGCHDN
jgi:hypothetical protein